MSGSLGDLGRRLSGNPALCKESHHGFGHGHTCFVASAPSVLSTALTGPFGCGGVHVGSPPSLQCIYIIVLIKGGPPRAHWPLAVPRAPADSRGRLPVVMGHGPPCSWKSSLEGVICLTHGCPMHVLVQVCVDAGSCILASVRSTCRLYSEGEGTFPRLCGGHCPALCPSLSVSTLLVL
jgi:hypothetical protein